MLQHISFVIVTGRNVMSVLMNVSTRRPDHSYNELFTMRARHVSSVVIYFDDIYHDLFTE